MKQWILDFTPVWACAVGWLSQNYMVRYDWSPTVTLIAALLLSGAYYEVAKRWARRQDQ